MMIKGQKINDRYQIIKTIGEGGMANVYLAYDTILDRNVAVKVLRGDLANDEKFVRRFQREALSASSLSHPNIVEMYDVGEDEGQYYIVMEYVEGKTLKQLIKKRGALTLSEVILQLTDGLAHAHESYIIHRDIKPQNILIMENGLIKITDFGIAVALNAAQLTQTNSVMGSVHYLPPEQANGKGSSVKSDIYSLGILMYELLTGTLPFKGENAVEIALKQMKEPLPDVTLENPDIPQSIENILLKATAKNPKNRYANVRLMYEDLKTALDEERKNEKRYVYQYPENDLDETIIMEKVEDINKQDSTSAQVSTKIEDSEEKKEKKKTKIAIIITSIIVGIILIAASIFFIFTRSENKEVKIPDVSDMSVVDAEEALKKVGLKVEIKTKKIESDEIDEGNIVKTEPAIGRKVKKGTKITLYESTGQEEIEMEDYVGQNYLEVKVKLEDVLGLKVLIETRNIADLTEDKENLIVEQNPKAGAKVSKGSTVTLYIPNMNYYPDMVGEKWTLDDVKEFANKYNLSLEVTEKESSTETPGTVIYQSRRAGSVISENVTFSVIIAKAKEVVQDNNNNNNDNSSTSDDDNDSDTTTASINESKNKK